MNTCKVVSHVTEKGYLHSLGRIQLAFALFHFVLKDRTCLLFQVHLDVLPLHSNPQLLILHLFFFFFLGDCSRRSSRSPETVTTSLISYVCLVAHSCQTLRLHGL